MNFDSILPDNTKAHQEKMTKDNIHQSHVDEHFKVATSKDKPQSYSNEILNKAARKWLIETNQICLFSLTLDFEFTTSPTSCFRLLSILHFERWSWLQPLQYTELLSSSILIGILHECLSHETIYLSWHCQSLVTGLFYQLESPLASIQTGSKAISSRPSSASNASSTAISCFIPP